MYILRPTLNLASKMKTTLSLNESSSTTLLGDWYANCFSVHRQQMILCVSEKTRLSVVMNAAPYSDFPNRFPLALQDVLRAIGIPEEMIELEIREMRELSLAKARNRSITGTLNEFIFQIEHKLTYEYGEPLNNFLDCSLYLSEVPCLTMTPSWPKQAVLEAFAPPISLH